MSLGRARSQAATARGRLTFSAGWEAVLASYLSPLLRGDLLLRGRLLRSWLHGFRGNLGINRLFRRHLSIIRVDRHHLSIIRINRLYVRL
jgi:hypothetical protein